MDLFSKGTVTDDWNVTPDASAAGRHANGGLDEFMRDGKKLDLGLNITEARVGPYSKDLPAVTIFEGANCSGPSARLYTTDDPDATGAEYRA